MLYTNPSYIKDINVAAQQCIGLAALENRNILVTGASGLIGSFIVDMLMYIFEEMNVHISICVLGRNKERLEMRFRSHTAKSNFHIIQHDITKPLSTENRFDYIIHAASNAHPVAFANDPVGTMLGNLLGTQYLLDYAWRHGTKRTLYVSSGEVYGQGAQDVLRFDETYSGYVDSMTSRACYPNSKRATETLCAAYASQFHADVVVARPCHIYGACTTDGDNRASAQFINNVINGQDIVLKSPGQQLRSYCYIADCASALLTILLRGETANAYNVANIESEVTILQLAETIARLSGRKVVFEQPEDAEKAGYSKVSRSVLNAQKLEALGWKAVYSLDEGIGQTISIRNSMGQQG